MKGLPTIRNMAYKIGYIKKINSVKYMNSRCVLNNLDSPVLAYGVGYAGFVAVFKDKQNFVRGVGFSVKHLETDEADASFYDMTVEKVLAIIKSNNLFIQKDVNEKELKDCKVKEPTPIIGEIQFKKNNHYDSAHYNIYRYKNGNYKVKKKWSKDSRWDWLVELNVFIKELESVNNQIIKNTVGKKHLENMKKQVVMEGI